MSARDDYKRCICDIFGAGEADCPQSGEDAPEPEPIPPKPDDADDEEEDEEEEEEEDPTPSPTPIPSWDELQEIKDNPHYPDGYSRTLY